MLLFPLPSLASGGAKGELNFKTNLLEDAVGTMSLGAEYRFSSRFSIDIMGAWNPWTFSGHMMYRQWNVAPQFRWWPGDKGHFLGLTIQGGEFNFNKVSLPFNSSPSLRDYRYDGWDIGAGLAYGYRCDVSRRFALEVMLGFGVSYVEYSKYRCHRCGEKLADGRRAYAGPMRTGVNLIYRIGADRHEPTGESEIEIPVQAPAQATGIAEAVDTVPPARQEIAERIVERVIHDTVYIKEYVIEQEEATRIRHASFALRLNYPVSSSQIIADYGNNRAQIDSLKSFIHRYITDPELDVISVDVNGYASIEGTAASNLSLSQRRAVSAADLIEWMYPALRRILRVRGLGEDWESLDLDGKDSLMRIQDPDMREAELRRREGEHCFQGLLLTQLPDTRRVECVINYTVKE